MPTVRDAVARARDALAAAGIAPAEAALDADLLARHVLGWDRARMLTDALHTPPASFERAYADVIARRVGREPVSHIIGHREFWGLDFEVTPDVLTPRPETELIVEEAIAAFPGRGRLVIADVGTGSGCLIIALALEFPDAEVVATDISRAALEVARRNARRHGVDRRVVLLHADLVPPLQRIDLLVSNPPYVPEADASQLSPDVRDHEPRVALFGGPDGLSVYRDLLPEICASLSDDGRAIVEVGYDQAAAVAALASATGLRLVRARQDLQGITRTLVFERMVPNWPRIASSARSSIARFRARSSTRTSASLSSTTSTRRRRSTCSSCRAVISTRSSR